MSGVRQKGTEMKSLNATADPEVLEGYGYVKAFENSASREVEKRCIWSTGTSVTTWFSIGRVERGLALRTAAGS